MKESAAKGSDVLNESVPDVSYEVHPRMHKAVNELVFGQSEFLWGESENAPKKQETKERDAIMLARFERIQNDVESFLVFAKECITDENELFRVKVALAFMLKLHLRDRDRRSGDPFAGHPLAVARRVLSTYTGTDLSRVVSAALLHDAVEDNAALLQLQAQAQQHLPVPIKKFSWYGTFFEEKFAALRKRVTEQKNAIKNLDTLIGDDAATLVVGVTTPLHRFHESRYPDKKIPRETKNAQYYTYVADTILAVDADPRLLVIKWADWQENMFDQAALKAKEHALREKGEVVQADALGVFREKLRIKYEPVLRELLLPYLKGTAVHSMSADHPLYNVREEMITQIEVLLDEQYTDV